MNEEQKSFPPDVFAQKIKGKNNILISVERNGRTYLFCGFNTKKKNHIYVNYFNTDDHLSLHHAFEPHVRHLRRNSDGFIHYETLDGKIGNASSIRIIPERAVSLSWYEPRYVLPLPPKLLQNINAIIPHHEVLHVHELAEGNHSGKAIGMKAIVLNEVLRNSENAIDDILRRYLNDDQIGRISEYRYDGKVLLISVFVRPLRDFGSTLEVMHDIDMSTSTPSSELVVKVMPKKGEQVIEENVGWFAGPPATLKGHTYVASCSVLLHMQHNISELGSRLHMCLFNDGMECFEYALGSSSTNAIESFEAAAEYFEAALKIQPNYIPALNQLGIALYRIASLQNSNSAESYLKRSESCFQSVTSLDPNYSKAYSNWGTAIRIRMEKRKWIDCDELARLAEEKYDRAIELNRANSLAYRNRGGLYFELINAFRTSEEKVRKLLTLAETDYRTALEINPNDMNAQKELQRLFDLKLKWGR